MSIYEIFVSIQWRNNRLFGIRFLFFLKISLCLHFADFEFLKRERNMYLLQIFLLIFVYFLGNFEVYCPPSPFAQHFYIQCIPLVGGVIENEFNLRSKEYLPAPTCHFQCIEYVSGVFRYFPPSVPVNKPVCVHPNLVLPNNFFLKIVTVMLQYIFFH